MTHWIRNWTPGEHETYRKRVFDLPAFRYRHETEPKWFFEALEKGWIVPAEGNKLHLIHGQNLQYAWEGDWLVRHRDHVEGIHHDQFVEAFEPTPKYAKLLTEQPA